MDYKILVLVLVAVAVLALLVLRNLSDWIDRSPWRRLVTGVALVMGAAIALQSLFPEIIRRLVG